MATELGIIDLLKVYGFDDRLKTKIVRHIDRRWDMAELIRDGWFDLYQSLQAKPVFKGCEQIVSFVGDGKGRARLIGVYRVGDERKAIRSTVPPDCPHKEWRKPGHVYYELKKCRGYSNLEDRVVARWSAERSWHQYLKNLPVIEIFAKGRVLEPFTDYVDFSLSHGELRDLVSHAGANRDWVSSLSAIAGVYLILAESTGHQYVGSAYGVDGIWGRWLCYAKHGHGGNVKLRELLSSDKNYPRSFRFSVLQVLPKTATKNEVLKWEKLYKQKLGSRATGLNLN